MTARSLIKVECYAGARPDEEPRRLVFADGATDVAAIEARWREPDGDRFRLRGEDGVVYQVHQDARSGVWRILAIDRPA